MSKLGDKPCFWVDFHITVFYWKNNINSFLVILICLKYPYKNASNLRETTYYEAGFIIVKLRVLIRISYKWIKKVVVVKLEGFDNTSVLLKYISPYPVQSVKESLFIHWLKHKCNVVKLPCEIKRATIEATKLYFWNFTAFSNPIIMTWWKMRVKEYMFVRL